MATKTPSIGEAISLQYKLPSSDFALQEIARRRREEQDAIDAARKAMQKSKELQDQYANDLSKFNVEGIIAPLQKEVQAYSANVFNHIKKKKADNPNYNPFADDELRTKKFELEQVLSKDRISSKTALEQIERGVANPDKFDIDNKFTDAISKGSLDEWNELTGGTGIYTTGILKPKEQLNKEWRKSLFNYSNQAGKVRTAEGAEYVPETTKKKLFEGWKNTPDYNAAVAEYGSKGIPLEKVDEMIYKQDWNHLFAETAAPEKRKGGLSFSFGGRTAENDDVRVVVSDTEDKRVYNIAQIKDPENSQLEFVLANGEVIKGTPLRIERGKKTGGKDVVISVPEIVDEEKTGKLIEKRVPYKLNEDRIFRGKMNFSIADIDKGITEEGVEVKSGTKPSVKKTEEYTNISNVKDAKGKTIKAGVKNGKWYNVETGKPL